MAYPKVKWTPCGQRGFEFDLDNKTVVEIEIGAENICVDREGKVVGFASDVTVEVWKNFVPGKEMPRQPDEIFPLKAGVQLEMETGTAIVVRLSKGILGISWAK